KIAWSGSGTIIGPHTILTASHVVWDSGTQQAITGVGIYPGNLPGQAPLPASVANLHFNSINDSNDSISKSDSQSDFAVLDVAMNLSGFGWFGREENFGGSNVNAMVAGYPGILNGVLFTDPTTVSADSQFNILNFGTFVMPGMSGGPVFVQ